MRPLRYDTLYYATWWLCAVTLPWTIPLNSVCIILLVIVWSAEGNWRLKWERLKKAAWVLPLFLFFGLHVLGLLYSQNLHTGLFELEKKLTFVLLPLMAASGKPLDETFLRLVKKGFVYSCTVLILGSLSYTTYLYFESSRTMNFDTETLEHFKLFNPTASPLWEYFSYIQVGRWMDLHPAYFSLHIILCMLILLEEIMDQGRISKSSLVLISLFTLFLSLLASRMAILSFFIILIYFLINQFQKRHWVPNMMALCAVLIVFAVLIALNPVSRFRLIQEPKSTAMTIHQQIRQWNSVNLRLLEWKASWSTIKNSWFLGQGTGDGQDALKDYYASYNDSTANMDFNAHNQYFQTLIELGLPGLVSLLACFFLPVFRSPNSLLHVSFVLLFSLMCLTECMLARQKGIVFFTLFQSLFLSVRPTLR